MDDFMNTLINDPNACHKNEYGFDRSGDVLYFAMSIGMLLICGAPGNTNRKECNERSGQIQRDCIACQTIRGHIDFRKNKVQTSLYYETKHILVF